MLLFSEIIENFIKQLDEIVSIVYGKWMKWIKSIFDEYQEQYKRDKRQLPIQLNEYPFEVLFSIQDHDKGKGRIL